MEADSSERELYAAGTGMDGLPESDRREVLDLLRRVERVPGAVGSLKVLRIRAVETPMLRQMWGLQLQKLAKRARDPSFPKPTWRDPGLKEPHGGSAERERRAVRLRDREEVLEDLEKMSERWKDSEVWTTCVFHGAASEDVAQAICELGFAGNIQRTKGWFGEGPYVSPSPAYAMRYAMGMQDFWEVRGARAFLVVARACWSQVYPVTQADNVPGEPGPGLKSRPVGGWAAPGAAGCDAHFACVRGIAPHGEEQRRTYRECQPGQRPDYYELVVAEECQLLPEYIMEVEVTEEEGRLQLAGLMMTTDTDRSLPDTQALGSVQSASDDDNDAQGSAFVVPQDSTKRLSTLWSQCAVCKVPCSGESLKQHEHAAHAKLLACLGCSKRFKCSDDLRKHSRVMRHAISAVFRLGSETSAAVM